MCSKASYMFSVSTQTINLVTITAQKIGAENVLVSESTGIEFYLVEKKGIEHHIQVTST